MHEAKVISSVQPVPPMQKSTIKAVIVDDSAPYLEALWSLMEFEILLM